MGSGLFAASGYSAPAGDDIVLLRLPARAGAEVISGVRQGDNPSFLCFHRGVLYAASEREDGAAVTAYTLGGDRLCRQGSMRVPGSGLCHLYAGERALYGCCYQSGHVFAADYALGRVLFCEGPGAPGPSTGGEAVPHAHWAQGCPGGARLLVADLGLSLLRIYPLKEGLPAGGGAPLPQPPGSGPRQVLFTPRGELLVVYEGGNALALYPAGGGEARRCPATGRAGENYPGGAALAPGGAVLFVGNRGADTIAAFSLEGGPRPLGEWPAGASWPRHLYAGAGGLVLAACQRGGALCRYRYAGGNLYPAGRAPLPGAACVVPVEPAG